MLISDTLDQRFSSAKSSRLRGLRLQDVRLKGSDKLRSSSASGSVSGSPTKSQSPNSRPDQQVDLAGTDLLDDLGDVRTDDVGLAADRADAPSLAVRRTRLCIRLP